MTKEPTMRVSTSLDKISIILFWEILKENNPLLLDKDYFEEKKYTPEQKEYIVNAWEKVYDDFYNHRNDSHSRLLLKKSHEKLLLAFKINLLTDAFNFLISIERAKDNISSEQYAIFIDKVKSLFDKIDEKVKFNVFDVDQSAKRVVQIIQAYEASYKMKHKQEEKKVNAEIENVYRQVANVEQILERSIPNINEISVLQWLAYEELANEKIKQIK